MAQHLIIFALSVLVLVASTGFVASQPRWCTVGPYSEACAQFPKPILSCTREFRPVCGIIGGRERQYGNKCVFCTDAGNSINSARITNCGPCRRTRPH